MAPTSSPFHAIYPTQILKGVIFIFLTSKSVALTKVKEFEKIARTKNNRDRKRNSVVCPHEGKIDS